MYAASGQKLKFEQTSPDTQNMLHCSFCGSYVRKAANQDKTSAAVAGAIGGALLGAAVGGPPGALIGGILGLLAGEAQAKKEQQ